MLNGWYSGCHASWLAGVLGTLFHDWMVTEPIDCWLAVPGVLIPDWLVFWVFRLPAVVLSILLHDWLVFSVYCFLIGCVLGRSVADWLVSSRADSWLAGVLPTLVRDWLLPSLYWLLINWSHIRFRTTIVGKNVEQFIFRKKYMHTRFYEMSRLPLKTEQKNVSIWNVTIPTILKRNNNVFDSTRCHGRANRMRWNARKK